MSFEDSGMDMEMHGGGKVRYREGRSNDRAYDVVGQDRQRDSRAIAIAPAHETPTSACLTHPKYNSPF